MTEFQLYKKRDFSAFMNDTLQFFKLYWKNYYRNYVVINGALLLLMCVLYFSVFKDMFKNLYTPNITDGSWLTNTTNPTLFAGGMLLFIVVSIALTVFSTAFPMIYLKLLKTKEENTITSSDIFNELKNYAGRMILFGLISFFIMIPLGIIAMAICLALSILIIGIPMLLLALPTFIVWSMQSMYIYLEEDTPYFSALGKGWKITFEKYWHVVGSTMVVFLFIMIISSLFNMVPAMMQLTSVFTSGGHPAALTVTPIMTGIYIIGMIFTFFANNILYIQQGLVYYSSQENSSNYQAFSEIENIGNDEA